MSSNHNERRKTVSGTIFSSESIKRQTRLIHGLRRSSKLSLIFPVEAKLKDGSPVQLVLADNRDIEPLRSLYKIIVEEGTSYPHDRFPDQDEFLDYWFRGKSTVAAYMPDRANVVSMAGA